jgi:ribose-phosphate pyrophosphokinase
VGGCQNEKNKYPILLGKKVRNAETGNIDLIQINNPEDYQKLPVMVVDDLCDGGGTFVGIANCIKQIDKNADISISVIHMVNSKGIVNLSQNYNKVYFTNTYKDWTDLPSNCEIFDVIQK